MSERRVNLEKILFTETDKLRKDLPDIDLFSNEEMKESTEFKYFINAMKEACRQTLELAAENAETEKEMLPECGVLKSVGIVNKQSILNTINQVE